jgi:sec-independent protein translocase protein TatB
MLGVNTWELALLALLFILLFGPERLPEIMGQVSRLLTDLREMTESATSELTSELAAASEEMQRTEAVLRDAGDTVTKALTGSVATTAAVKSADETPIGTSVEEAATGKPEEPPEADTAETPSGQSVQGTLSTPPDDVDDVLVRSAGAVEAALARQQDDGEGPSRLRSAGAAAEALGDSAESEDDGTPA